MLAAISLLLVASLPAHARCASGSITTLPATGSALPAGHQLTVTATSVQRDPLESWLDLPLTLVSEGRSVPVRVLETLRGSHRDTQAVLQVEGALTQGHTWTLAAAGVPVSVQGAPLRWQAVPATPTPPPTWHGAPQVIDHSRVAYGCGPEVWVEATAVTSAPWVEATVYPVSGGDPATQRLPVADGKIAIGHGMCSGPFELEAGREYFAELVAVDALGRRSAADDSPIRFTAP